VNTLNFITGVVKLIPLVIGAVHAVESIAGKDKHGKEKQDAAIDAIGAMISSAELTFGREIMDVPEFNSLVRKLIDDYVAVQNFVKKWKESQQH
jgi:hypothetical protein